MAGEITINCTTMELANIRQGAAWTQAKVDAVWKGMGYPAPAPILPPSMVGWVPYPTRGPRMLSNPKVPKLHRGVNAAEAKFLNFWAKAITDPCRKQSGISKIAGGILQVASVFMPALAFADTVASTGNALQELKSQKDFIKTGTELLTEAANAAPMNPAPITTMPAPAPLVPTYVAPITQLTAQPQPARAITSRRTYTPRDYAIMAGLGVGLYLLLRRIRTR